MTGWPRNAYVGQHVVCVAGNGAWRHLKSGKSTNGPRYNEIVTISGIKVSGGKLGFFFSHRYGDRLFLATWFRPLDENKLDVFKEMLNPVKQLETQEI